MNKRPPLRRSAPVEAENDGVIEGRNAVTEALRAGVAIDKIFSHEGRHRSHPGPHRLHRPGEGRCGGGRGPAEAGRHEPHPLPPGRDRRGRRPGVCQRGRHPEHRPGEGGAPLIVVCDELSDPHNLGAVIRTADAAGAHGVIIPKRRSAGLTAVVAKTSAGAVAHVPVARVPNLTALLKELKDKGVWVFGTAAGGTTQLYQADLKGPAAIVIGSARGTAWAV